jgi:hypothetical protein
MKTGHMITSSVQAAYVITAIEIHLTGPGLSRAVISDTPIELSWISATKFGLAGTDDALLGAPVLRYLPPI